MKASLDDYLLSTLALSVLLAASVWPVWTRLVWSNDWFGDCHMLVDLALALPFYGVLSALAIWVLLRLRPMQRGTCSIDSPTFTWRKLITALYHFGQCALKPLTPIFLTPVVAMLYGSKPGRGVALGGVVDAPFAVTIRDRVTVGAIGLVSGNFTSRESLIRGTVTIGSGATIGVNAVVFPSTEIGENAMLLRGSYLDLPAAEIGDLVVVFQSGAYGASASPQAFLGHPPCVEVLD